MMRILISQQCKGVCEETRNLFIKQLTTLMIHYATEVLDELCKMNKSFINYEVSYCIKLIGQGETVFTFARSSNTKDTRKDRSSNLVPLQENSDFELLKENASGSGQAYFYQSDLNEFDKNIRKLSNGILKYKNSNSDWRNEYIGTMVVPIGHVSQKGDNDKETFLVRGFLCADSMSRRAFHEKQRSINVRFFRGYAQIFSIVLNKYQELINQKWEG